MIVEIDLTGEVAKIALADPEDCKRFHVTVRGGNAGALAAALSQAEVGHLLSSGDAMIETAAITRLVKGRVAENWDGEFAAMVAYAKLNGWVDNTGASLQAHVKWST